VKRTLSIPKRRLLAALTLLLTLSGGTGCTVFGDYNVATEEPRRAFLSGNFDAAVKGYSEELDAVNDSLLYRLEAAMAAHVGKSYRESFQLFDVAYKRVVEYQDRALMDAANIAQQVGRIVVNEKTVPYTGEIFEQVLLQAYQAKNVYLSGERDGVITEALRCYDIIKKARRIYEEELRVTQERAEQEQQDAPFDAEDVRAKMRKAYAYQDKLKDPEDVYDLRYVRFLVAWLRDAVADRQADYNSALIDMKFVADRFGEVDFVRRDLARLTGLSGDPEGAQQLYQQYGLKPVPRDWGSVALFFEAGTAPKKRQFKMIFPTATGAAAFAMPIYEPTPNPVAGAVLHVGNQQAETLVMTDLEQVAYRYHNDRLPLMIARQIIRLALKIAVQEGGRAALQNNADGWAALAWTVSASVWNVVSEQADLRCWRTLPHTLQATRLYLPAGDYPLKVSLIGAGGGTLGTHELGTIRIAPGRHRMINARSLGRALHSDVPQEDYDG